MLAKVVAELEKTAKDVVLGQIEAPDDDCLMIERSRIKAVCRVLKDNPACDFKLLVDLTCVDWLGQDERFEVVYQLYSITHNYRLRLKARVPEGESIDTVSDVWRGALHVEREVYDMFGVDFAGHPKLTRILMYDEFEGHALRKDYPLKKHQPRVPLRWPIEPKDDPPYNWTRFQRARKLGLDDD